MTNQCVVARREWRWVLLVSLVALTTTCVPYLLGWALETSEWTFSGCILLVDDCYSYLAKMRQGAEGDFCGYREQAPTISMIIVSRWQSWFMTSC